MNSIVFFGSLRSKKLLKIIIENNLSHLKFYNAQIFKSKLFKVKNENFPYLEKSNLNNDLVECSYIINLTKQDFNKIKFYESIEYKLSKINIHINNKKIETQYFELIKKNKTKKKWIYEIWRINFEKISCVAAKEWMSLYNEYKSNPENAEIYWQDMLLQAKKKLKIKD